jgi:hypothetical protein
MTGESKSKLVHTTEDIGTYGNNCFGAVKSRGTMKHADKSMGFIAPVGRDRKLYRIFSDS